MEPILETQDLHKYYADNHAVKGISFAVQAGEIFSLLGPNGAGKTTTISMLSGLLAPSQGDAVIDGKRLSVDPMGIKRVIGVVPQEIALYPGMTARENLVFWGRMYGLSGQGLARRVTYGLELADLADRAGHKVETFSGGMKRRLNIAVGLLHQPKLLFLDEPTVGIDPQSRRRILDTIVELNRQGLTVLYTTHYMEEAQELSNRIGIIDHGQLIALGTLAELIRQVGELETLQLELQGDGRREVDLVAGLSRLGGVRNVARVVPEGADASDGPFSLGIQADDAESVLPDVVAYLNGCGVHIKRMEIREPNLEAVFLHLTGRALRD